MTCYYCGTSTNPDLWCSAHVQTGVNATLNSMVQRGLMRVVETHPDGSFRTELTAAGRAAYAAGHGGGA